MREMPLASNARYILDAIEETYTSKIGHMTVGEAAAEIRTYMLNPSKYAESDLRERLLATK